ncbi:MAG: PEP-CTERM sorting domain-containing protein [Planctomycetota bacterium]
MTSDTRKKTLLIMLVFALLLAGGTSLQAEVIEGTISDWHESPPTPLTIGDGTNHVSLYWSIMNVDRGWFYGSGNTSDSDVAFATGVTDIFQIVDASIFSFTDGAIGPHYDADADPDGVGDFIAWRNIHTGHYGVLRIDDIYVPGGGDLLDARLNGTWWFQTDGTGNFVPEPATLLLLGLGGLALLRKRRG